MNSKYSGSMGQQRLIKTMKNIGGGGGGGGGGALTNNSVDSVHILNGAVDTDEIADGAITIPKFAPDFVNVLQEMADRIMALEQTAIIRSFDTQVTPLSNFSIPVNLVESESVEINVNILVGGIGAQSVFLKYNTASATNLGWGKYNGTVTYGETSIVQALDGGNGTGVNNGIIAVLPISGQCMSVKVELFRSFDINTPSQKYYMKTRSLSFFNGNTYGLTKIDSQGSVENDVITGLHFSVAAGTTLKASYSIIKDQRRTAQNGPLL